MPNKFHHHALKLVQKNKIIFTSFSKRNFYLRSDVSRFVLNKGQSPISPFMNFDYNLAGIVKKDYIRIANNSLIKKADELWVFGEVSDGVLVEIYLALKFNKPVKYFQLQPTSMDFQSVKADRVVLEDVSPWMWEWVLTGRDLSRWHPRLRFHKTYPIIYPAYSKRNFYWQMHISKFCLDRHVIPLNPFMLFRYFLGDSVPRSKVYLANNNIVRISDELWSFGEISDGVLAEIDYKHRLHHPVQYYKLTSSQPRYRRVTSQSAVFENEALEVHRSLL